MEMLSDFFDWFVAFFTIPGEDSFFTYLQAQYVIAAVKVKLFLLKNAWDVASVVLQQMQITPVLQGYLNALPSDVVIWISTFRIPDCMNILLNAHATRFVLKVLG